MTTRSMPLAGLGLLAAQLCLAAPLYKVVGPDGKVSFTDQPPVSASAQVQAVKAPVNQAKVVDIDGDPLAASAAVYAKQTIVESGTRFCMLYAPSTAHNAVVARDAWRARNSAVTDKKNKVLASLMSPAERAKFGEQSERQNEDILEKMRAAPQAEKLKWCQNVPASFASPELDVSRNAILVRTIMQFKAAPTSSATP